MTERAIVDPIVVTATEQLFAPLGVVVVSDPGRVPPPLDRVAVIGFAGEGVRGALGLGVGADLLDALATPITGLGGGLYDDWLAESANQLLGRVKNRMLRHGAAIGMALPMVLRGMHIDLLPTSGEVWTYPFVARRGAQSWQFCVWLDAVLERGISLAPAADPSIEVPEEGELVLF